MCPDTSDAKNFEREINDWLNSNLDIDILSMTVNANDRDGSTSMVFFVVYDDSEDDDEGDELTVTLPHITVKEIRSSHQIPNLR